jgi:hypothetical protein
MTNKEQIIEKALEFLSQNPDGLRYSELVRLVHGVLATIPVNTVHGTVWNLDAQLPEKVIKPAKGLFKLVQFVTQPERPEKKLTKIIEDDFYLPFSDYIVNELEECTKAIPLGGNRFRDKWGTPDVIGKRESRKSDIVKLSTEIVSVEIKTDTNNLVTAFGQACAYKLFSHKSYLVVPNSSSEEDLSRIDSLCLIFGIGLILFNNLDPMNPNFQIRNRPIKNDPDRFYVNKYAKLIERELFE